ncbi:MAG: GNAT family N-acetyltransferase [Sinobacteraceae bacterium]|nr:GNAT family N-acetyltransferase [Nevskiaceae bacterium]
MSQRSNEYGQPIGVAVPDWTERPRPARVVLQGQYSRIEPVDVARHAADLFEAYMEAPDGRYWTYLFSERPEAAESFSAYLSNLSRSQDPLHYTILDAAANRAVGTAALMRIEPVHGVIEVGSITFAPRMQGTRIGTEAMYLLARYVFDELGYRRYEWKCDSLNAPSRRAALRYGFSFEGIFRQAILYKGRNRDTAWYSIISPEWPLLRAAFESWLQPTNFDEAGRQKRSLAEIRSAL